MYYKIRNGNNTMIVMKKMMISMQHKLNPFIRTNRLINQQEIRLSHKIGHSDREQLLEC